MFLAIFTLIDLALLHNAFQLLVNNSLAVGNECEKILRWGQHFCGWDVRLYHGDRVWR